jgi:hypothetical protein
VADLRSDVGAFAHRALGRPLWDHQLEAARSEAFVTTIAAARRTGKTTLVETLAAWTCFRERGVRALILSATQDAARRVTESIGATLAAREATRGAVVEDYATRVRLTNGSEIISLPASQRQVRGYGAGVKLLVIDEAGFVPEDLWRAASYVALDERASGSRIVLAGTPWGSTDLFFRRAYEAGLAGDPDYASHHWTYEVNPGLDRAYLERQRARVSPAEYAAEVEGRWSDSAGSLFARELLDAAIADVEVPSLDELAPPARPILGLDWGVSFDRSAAAAVYRLPLARLNPGADPLPRYLALPYLWPQRAPLHQVVDDVVACPVSFAYVATETNGVGAMPSQELHRRLSAARVWRRWAMVATTAATKTAAYGALLGLLERGQLVLPRHPDLLRQLAGLRFEQGERGFTRIEADDPATHDDISDALALACLPYRPRGAALRCALAEMADPAVAVPDAGAPELDEPIVATGAGLRLYRRPPLQSAAGPELTLPAGARALDPATAGRRRLRDRVLAATTTNEGGP